MTGSPPRTIFPILETLAARPALVLGVPFAAAVVTSVIVLLMPRPTRQTPPSYQKPRRRPGCQRAWLVLPLSSG